MSGFDGFSPATELTVVPVELSPILRVCFPLSNNFLLAFSSISCGGCNIVRSKLECSRCSKEFNMIPASMLGIGERKCSVGCPIFDALLKGGIPCGKLTEIFGESASAKTQLCLQLLISVQLPRAQGGLQGSALYVYTESYFPIHRLQELAAGSVEGNSFSNSFDYGGNRKRNGAEIVGLLQKPNFEPFVGDSIEVNPRKDFRRRHKTGAVDGNRGVQDFGNVETVSRKFQKSFDPCDNIFVQAVQKPEELLNFLDRADALLAHPFCMPVKLIVIDSIAALFRSDFDSTIENMGKKTELYFQLASKLKKLAHMYNLVVVVTNQVVDYFWKVHALDRHACGPFHAGETPNLITSGRRVVPALGLSWSNCVNLRIFLARHSFGGSNLRRRLQIVFSPHLPCLACEFEIHKRGVRGLASDHCS